MQLLCVMPGAQLSDSLHTFNKEPSVMLLKVHPQFIVGARRSAATYSTPTVEHTARKSETERCVAASAAH